MNKVLLIIGLFYSQLAFSQGSHVTGNVLDRAFDKRPLAFANVKVKGLDLSVETDLSGCYSLELTEGEYTLVVDFVGYKPVEINNVQVSNIDLNLGPVSLQRKEIQRYADGVSKGL